VRVTVNGEPREVPDGLRVSELVSELGLRAELVAVERNRELVPRSRHAATVLAQGDELEVVTLVGGG